VESAMIWLFVKHCAFRAHKEQLRHSTIWSRSDRPNYMLPGQLAVDQFKHFIKFHQFSVGFML